MGTLRLRETPGERGPRVAAPLRDKTEKRLRAYALAAGAAGVGLLAAVQPATGQTVSTPTNSILTNGALPFDINGDGIVDFTLHVKFLKTIGGPSSFLSSRQLKVTGNPGASVVVHGKSAAAFQYGSIIGSSRRFQNANTNRVDMARVGRFGCGSSCYGTFGSGVWQHTQDRYLGLKFEINGETHYGWARLSTQSSRRPVILKVKLSGYAYETVPNQPIKAGEPGGSTSAGAELAPGTLGALSRGFLTGGTDRAAK